MILTPTTCDLCGLPLRDDTITLAGNDRRLAFCCQGCRMVYTMLLESTEVDDPARFRESDLFRQCVAAGVIPADEADLQRLREAGPATSTPPPEPTPDNRTDHVEGTLTLDLKVEGMWCPACAWVIEKALSRQEGVKKAACHFSTDRLRCHYRPEHTDPARIRQTVARLGYVARDATADGEGQSALRRELVRLIITGLLSANVMMLSWALYAGFFTDLSEDAVFKISLPIALMATAVFFYGGGPMLRRAWHGLIHLAPGMETLVGLAAGCAYLYSLFNWITGSIHLYFDTASMLITLVLLGKLLERQARNRVRRDLDNFFALQPTKVRMVTDQWPAGRYVAIERIAAGDRFAVEEGDIVPADGRVVTGRAVLDEASLTGEPRPVRVKPGDPVKSGTRVAEGRVTATVDQVGESTVLGQMIAIMERSLEHGSPFEGRTAVMLRGFVPTIIALAVATGFFCVLTGLPLDQALVRAVTVMVISCPCALGVAIPMARLAGISLAGRRGILVRDGEAFERADTVDSVVFDKTGTLTHGRWKLTRIDCRPGTDREPIIAWAAGLERSADHEIARSITAEARRHGIAPAAVTDIRIHANGIEGRMDGRVLRIGNGEFVGGSAGAALDWSVGKDPAPTSPIFLDADGRVVARFCFGDTIRASVPPLMETLKTRFREIVLVSGDDRAATARVAEAIGVTTAHGGLLPADKAGVVDELTRRGLRPVMVGDGINDAAAMVRAHLAVAVHNGQSLAAEAAHLTLIGGDPAQLIDVLALSRRVNRKVKQNLWCAWGYNLVSIPVAMGGLLTPLVAATAMLLSSLTVIGNTLLLLRRG